MECRICRSDEEDGELFHPCKCTGSIKYVHQECLSEWIVHAKKPKCELCGHTWQFIPIYATPGTHFALPKYIWYAYFLAKDPLRKLALLGRAVAILSLTAILLQADYMSATVYGDVLARAFLSRCGVQIDIKIPTRFKVSERAELWAQILNRLVSGWVLIGLTLLFFLALWMITAWTLQDKVLDLEVQHILDFGREWTGAAKITDKIEQGDRRAIEAMLRQDALAGEIDAQEIAIDLLVPLPDDEFEVDQDGWFWALLEDLFGAALLNQFQTTLLTLVAMSALVFCVYMLPYFFGVLDYAVLGLYFKLSPVHTLELRILCFLIGTQQIVLYATAPYLFFFKLLAPYPAGRQLLAVSKQFASIQKVFMVVFVEAVAFPIFCGVLVHISILPILENPSFVSTLAAYPRSHVLLWWSLGMFYMFTLSDFFRNCRQFLRPGVLYFIQDPSDPRNEPIRHFLASSLWSHFKKIAFSALIYLGLILGCIGGTSALVALLLPVRPICIEWPERDTLRLWPFALLFVYLVTSKKAIASMSAFSKVIFEREFRRVSAWLNLGSFLFGELPQPGSGNFVRAPKEDSHITRRNARLFAAVTPQDELVDLAPKGLGELKHYALVWRPSFFWVRVVALLAWIVGVSVLICLAIVLVPLLLAREYSATLLPTVRTDYTLYIVGFCWCAAAAYNARHISTAKEAVKLVLSALLRGNVVYAVAPIHPATPMLSSIIYGWCLFVPWPPSLGEFSVVEYLLMTTIVVPVQYARAAQLAVLLAALWQPHDWKQDALNEYYKIGELLVNVGEPSPEPEGEEAAEPHAEPHAPHAEPHVD